MMLSNPATSSRVHALLKDDILRGRFLPRTILVERSLANDYGTSVTPVRNAACQLVGERLLALHAGGGYEIPDIGVVELRDLYFWHGQLVRSALRSEEHTSELQSLMRISYAVFSLQQQQHNDSITQPQQY